MAHCKRTLKMHLWIVTSRVTSDEGLASWFFKEGWVPSGRRVGGVYFVSPYAGR